MKDWCGAGFKFRGNVLGKAHRVIETHTDDLIVDTDFSFEVTLVLINKFFAPIEPIRPKYFGR